MKRTLSLCILLALVVVVSTSFLITANQLPVPPDTNGMTYTEWCQHIDQLTQNLRSATPTYWIRSSIDIAVELVGFVIFAGSLVNRGVLEWQQVVGAFLTLAGAVDFFAYNSPPYYRAILDYQMWKEAGGSHMWLYPCTASTRE